MGRYATAVSAYREAIRLKPDLPFVWTNLGAAYDKLGDYPKAAEACREAIRLKPDDAKAWYHLGAANAKMGRREDVLIAYNMLKRLDTSLANEYFEKVVFLGDAPAASPMRNSAREGEVIIPQIRGTGQPGPNGLKR